jgi:hypothetical protein
MTSVQSTIRAIVSRFKPCHVSLVVGIDRNIWCIRADIRLFPRSRGADSFGPDFAKGVIWRLWPFCHIETFELFPGSPRHR